MEGIYRQGETDNKKKGKWSKKYYNKKYYNK